MTAGEASRRETRSFRTLGPVFCLCLSLACSPARDRDRPEKPRGLGAQAVEADAWPAYGRDAGGSRYSPLAQVTRENVQNLEVAWVFRTGDYLLDGGGTRFEATPLFVDGVLYVSTPFGRVIALDPERGAERWSFDPGVDLEGDYGDFANRGVSTHLDPDARPGEACRRRIFVASIDARLFALDAVTGKPCPDFGTKGEVDLKADVMNPPAFLGEYQVTSPPAVVRDLVIVGSSIADNQRVDAPSGVVRAFDARTGRKLWSFDPIPRNDKLPGSETWKGGSGQRTGAANVWSVISADAERDLVFLPVGSASPDYYGGERRGSNLFANSVVALRASTGQLVWHFQTVHHDLWDYDVPAQPVLVTLRRGAEEIPAVVQATKTGHLFLLHRETGQPLFPVEERPVPASTVPGEEAFPTQPFPLRPPRLVPDKLTAAEVWGLTPQDRQWCRQRLSGLRSEGIFTPPSLEGTVVFPGNIGGSHWGGVAYDPVRGLVITPTNRLAFLVKLVPQADYQAARRAAGAEENAPQARTPYGMLREPFLTSARVPCNPPPWGALTAVDLESGSVRWEVPLGTVPALAGVPGTEGSGSPNLGGAMITAGGLAFIGATFDQNLRAFDVETGKELWKAPLPAGGNATPMTYRAGPRGRQFVLIAAGGHGDLGTKLGDHVVAFALPDGEKADAKTQGELGGVYTGQFIGGRTRYAARAELRESPGGEVAGKFMTSDPEISGTLTGRRSGAAVAFEIPFSFPERNCTGTMTGTAELANGATLFVGEVAISGPCVGQRQESGTFALRRAK